jgi:hypothetical protein
MDGGFAGRTAACQASREFWQQALAGRDARARRVEDQGFAR